MGMTEGSKRTLIVPAHLVYGERQIGKYINLIQMKACCTFDQEEI